ncbi:MAG TPA: DUF2780 domain-containing protein [Pirellulaceae bacterium]|nr:DUF2780 domain-containing protein [Pirellulaceae bacterium]
MNPIEGLVEQVSKSLGIDATTARGAVAQVMSFLQTQLGEADFGKLLGSIPGTTRLADSVSSASSDAASGGLFGAVGQLAGSLFGASAGESLELAGRLQGLGLDSAQIATLASRVADFVQQFAGDDALATLRDKVPALKQLLG